MATRIKLSLPPHEYEALQKSAESELRTPNDQAHYIVKRELEKQGLLPASKKTPPVKDLSRATPTE